MEKGLFVGTVAKEATELLNVETPRAERGVSQDSSAPKGAQAKVEAKP